MKDQERQIITNVYNTLVETIKLSPLILGDFEALEHIGSSDTDHILAKPQGHTQVYTLLEILKSRDAFSDLHKVLRKHKQFDAVQAILTETEKRSQELYQTLLNLSSNDSERSGSGTSQPSNTGTKLGMPKLSESKPKQEIGKPDDPRKFEYNLPPTGRGLILAINIVEFDDPSHNRDSAIRDSDNIKMLFPAFGFTPFPENFDTTLYYKKEDILKLIEDFKAKCNETKAKAAIVFIGSHGRDGRIGTSDMQTILVNNIISKFYHDEFEYMEDRPKIFIVQACRRFRDGEDDDMFKDFKIDAEADDGVKSEFLEPDVFGCPMADTIIIKSQVPGHKSYRMSPFGSYLMHFITEVFFENLDNGGSMTVREMLEEVVLRVQKKVVSQVPEIKMIKFKDYTL